MNHGTLFTYFLKRCTAQVKEGEDLCLRCYRQVSSPITRSKFVSADKSSLISKIKAKLLQRTANSYRQSDSGFIKYLRESWVNELKH